MTALKLFGASLLLLSGIVFLRSYTKYEREKIKTAGSLLALLRRATEAKSLLTPIAEIVKSIEDELLLSRGFVTEYKESLSLDAAYLKVAGRYSSRVFSLLREEFSHLCSAPQGSKDYSEIEKISAALELEKQESEKNIKVRGTLTIAAVLGLIILFL